MKFDYEGSTLFSIMSDGLFRCKRVNSQIAHCERRTDNDDYMHIDFINWLAYD